MKRTEAKQYYSLVMLLAIETILGKKLFTAESKTYNKYHSYYLKKKKKGWEGKEK